MQNSNLPFVTPSSTCLSEDLLFFDTFSHVGSEKDNFDLVQFPIPVIIDLIKIVPLGQPVEANIPGNVRLGATNPSKCELEFYINDLTKQDAYTMTDIGKFCCNERDTDYSPPVQIQTDGLLLKGSYRTLTLAIFGQTVSYDEKSEDQQQISSAASPPAQTPASPVASENELPYLVRNVEPGILRRTREEEFESIDEFTLRSGEMVKEESFLDDPSEIHDEEQISDERSMDLKGPLVHDDLSSEDVVGIAPNNNEEIDYLSENDFERSSNNRISVTREEYVDEAKQQQKQDEESKSDIGDKEEDLDMGPFKVESFRPISLQYFTDPSLTLQERVVISQQTKSNSTESIERSVKRIREAFSAVNFSDSTKLDNWVIMMDDLTNEITNMSLSQTTCNDDMLNFLVQQLNYGLDLELALKHSHSNFVVRHLKAGIKLATSLFHCGEKTIMSLLDASIPQKVLRIYEGHQMSLPVRLLILKCLSAACDSVSGVKHLSEFKYDWQGSQYHPETLLKELTQRELNTDSKSPTKTIVAQQPASRSPVKTDISETTIKIELGVAKANENSDEKDECSKKQLGAPVELTCYEFMTLILISQPKTRITIAIGSLMKKIRLHKGLADLSIQTQSCKRTSQADCDESEDSVFESERSVPERDECNFDKCLELLQDSVALMRNHCVEIAQPHRHLPAKLHFQIKQNPFDPHVAVFKWVKHYRTLESIRLLIESSSKVLDTAALDSVPTVDVEKSIKLQMLCLILVQQLAEAPRGTHLLLSKDCHEITGSLLRLMADRRQPKRTSHLRVSDGIENHLSDSLCREESLLVSRFHNLALRLSYDLKLMILIDQLFQFHRVALNKSSSNPISDPEVALNQIYTLMEHPYGLAACLKHFSTIGNLDCVLRFLDIRNIPKELEFVHNTAVDMALDIIGTFLSQNEQVLEIAEEYSDTLMELYKSTEDKKVAGRIKSFLTWLTPFDTDKPLPMITYSEESIRLLTRAIRDSIPDASIPFVDGLDFVIPQKLITAVRILRQLCIPNSVESFIKATFDNYSTEKLLASAQIRGGPSSFGSVANSSLCSNLISQDSHGHWNLNLQLANATGQVVNSTLFSSNQPLGSTIDPYVDETLADQLNQIANTFKLFQPYEETICGQLRYHYAITLFHEQEGLKRLLNALCELVGNFPQPSFQAAALCHLRGRIVISFLNSVVLMLHSLTCHLIDARGSDFRNTTLIPVILETYSLLSFVPKGPKNQHDAILTMRNCGTDNAHHQRHHHPHLLNHHNNDETNEESDLTSLQRLITIRTDNYQLAQQVKRITLSILMSYTQMCLSVSESEEKVISKSMWTKMLNEVIDFTLSAPQFFLHGLDVLTKIIPSPFPRASAMDSIDQEQLFKSVNYRKLWSAHLHPVHHKIEQLISQLSICVQPEIRSMLVYFCNQLCDLSSNAACLVAKTIVDTLLACTTKIPIDSTCGSPSDQTSLNHQDQTSATSLVTNQNVDHQSSACGQQQSQQPPSSQSQSVNASTKDQSGPANVANQDSNYLSPHLFKGFREVAYATKMCLNLLSNLLASQSFETALSNHLQLLGRKDDRYLTSLQNTLKLFDSYRPADPNAQNQSLHHHLVDTIKSLNGMSGPSLGTNNNNHNEHDLYHQIGEHSKGGPSSASKGASDHRHQLDKVNNAVKMEIREYMSLTGRVCPPEDMVKVNLVELGRRTSELAIDSGIPMSPVLANLKERPEGLAYCLKKTHRLKVLLDMVARDPRSKGLEEVTGASLTRGSGTLQMSATSGPTNTGSAYSSTSKRHQADHHLGSHYGELPPASSHKSSYSTAQRGRVSGGRISGSGGSGAGGGPGGGLGGIGSGVSGGVGGRPDSFRSRPQNTSRPPSIHVDDFVDLYGAGTSGRGKISGPPMPLLGPPGLDYHGRPTGERHPYFGPGSSRSGRK